MIKNSTYDKFKKSATVIVPAIATLYYALALIWGLPKAEEVVASLAAVNTFQGVVLGVLSKKYVEEGLDGDLIVSETADPNSGVMSLAPNKHPMDFLDAKTVTFRVVHPPE